MRLKLWQAVRNTRIWQYYENRLTGRRAARKIRSAYQPLDYKFMRDGDAVISPLGNYVIGAESEIVHIDCGPSANGEAA